MYHLRMSKNINIEDDTYEALKALKLDKRDSFTRVIRRLLPQKCNTAGELLEAYETMPPPDIDWDVLDKIAAGRGRRSGGRK